MIAITFALPAESADFVRLLEQPRLISREGVENIRGRLHGKLVAVIHTGVGKMVCRERMEVMLRRERFEYLISTGFAGALEKELRVGHLLVSENYSSPKILESPALDLADEGTFLGRLATVPRMIEAAEQRETLNKRTGAAAVDMETETIAELCAAHDLPILSLRAISDAAGEPFPAPAHVLFDLAKQKTNFVRLGSYLLTHPGAVSRLNAFRQRIGVARKLLADTLDKILRADLV
ncbi:MAG: adenosylhomocysteine nucleosidase [Verrucomicrobiota bacterium]|jgi:adenosylhomocysteine nucleosidase